MTGPNANPFDDGYWDDFPAPKEPVIPDPERGWKRAEPLPPDIADALFDQEFDVLVKQREVKP